MSETYSLILLPEQLAVCRLEADTPYPEWAKGKELFSLTRTADELSVVCEAKSIPENISAERGWRALKVRGPLEFSMVGVVAKLSIVLAEAEVSIFVISTYETDYILVKEEILVTAIQALRDAGHRVSWL